MLITCNFQMFSNAGLIDSVEKRSNKVAREI